MTPTSRLSKQDYKRLAEACVTALLQGSYDTSIEVVWPTGVKLLKDIPRGSPQGFEHGDPRRETHRVIGAKKLLKWLHSKGYSPWSWEDVDRHGSSLSQQIRRCEEGLFAEVNLDINQDGEYNSGIEVHERLS